MSNFGGSTRRALLLVLTFAAAATTFTSPARGSAGETILFRPSPVTLPDFGVRPAPAACRARRATDVAVVPSDEPFACDGQKHYVATPAGDVYVETARPTRTDGELVPGPLHTILLMTPYVPFDAGVEAMHFNRIQEHFVRRGYAVAIAHVPGTGNSDGCLSFMGPAEVQATAHVIDFLARRSPWKGDGAAVGMVGLSYTGSTSVAVASEGDPALIEPLKAIVPFAPVTSAYDYVALNGVSTGTGAAAAAAHTAISALVGDDPPSHRTVDPCSRDFTAAGAQVDLTGDHASFWVDRERRDSASNVTAATLLFQGLADRNVFPSQVVGWFDRIRSTTPHKLVLGQWEHEWPDGTTGRNATPKDRTRADWLAMVHAWFDHYVAGLPAGVERWPNVQVQDSASRWRAEAAWPSTGGQAGHLPLVSASGPAATFDQARAVQFDIPTPEGLHIAGQPVADLWLTIHPPAPGLTAPDPDAHVLVSLEVVGFPPVIATTGARSITHREPMVNGYFTQSTPKPPSYGEPFRLVVPILPTDLVVPPGGTLRVSVGGAAPADTRGSTGTPAASTTTITVHQDCGRQSLLRFRTPDETAPALDVQTNGVAPDAWQPVAPRAGRSQSPFHPLCDQPPIDPQDALRQ